MKKKKDELIKNKTTNILLCGVGGQGIILASSIISNVFLKAGYDVKKSEVHGMSQRGGAVTSHVRYGIKVYSPLIPAGEVDFLYSLNPVETLRNKHYLSEKGIILECDEKLKKSLKDIRAENICLIGLLSKYIDIEESIWIDTLKEKIKPDLYEINIDSFVKGRNYIS